MAIKDMLVHLDGAPAGAARLDFAAALARRHGAHLIGLFVAELPLPVLAGADMGGGAALAALFERLQADADAEAARVEAAFREVIRREGLAGEWRRTDGMTPAQVALQGRYADLILVGQAEADGTAAEAVIEAALFTSGRPVLLVPHAGRPALPGRRVLIGWKPSREAARAVHDALPLMAGAEQVVVLTVNPESGADGHGEEPGADIATHLARHGLKVEVRRVTGSDLGAGEMLLNEAADGGADLIVMGGYGHSRFREFMLGGATRTLLGQMTVPVLMAH